MTDALYTAPIELKRAGITAEGSFSGYASTFGPPPDRAGDIVVAGAFARTLSEHKAAKTVPALLWGHDLSQPIGKWTSLAEDFKGLRVTGQLTLGVERGRDALALMRDDALALSIGYRTRKRDVDRDGSILLKDLELLEISAVALPANPFATITNVKGAIRTSRDLEHALHSMGYSRTESRRIVAGGWKALQDDTEELTAALAILDPARLPTF